MATPGLSFDIVRSAGPILGIRSDRTAIIALTERGPVERPVLVHSHEEFVERFGDPVAGMLGALAASGYYANGGEDLIVARFVPAASTAASANLLLCISGTVRIAASEPGAFGNRISVRPEIFVRRRATGNGSQGSDTVTVVSGDTPLESDEGLPVRVSFANGVVQWTRLEAVETGNITLEDGLLQSGTVGIEVFEPTFSLAIFDPPRAALQVEGLDLHDLPAARTKLTGTPVTFTGDSLTDSDLPVPESVRLGLGDDGMAPGIQDSLRDSFLSCARALEASGLPDIVVAPDLWSRIYLTKGVSALAFDSSKANELADELVRSAARTSDRVVLVDPPLVGDIMPRTESTHGLADWRSEREAALGPDRDFAACFAPWIRVIAGPRYKGDDTLLVPPSAWIAGRMARLARERGPWIAVGNVAVEQAIGVSTRTTPEDEQVQQDVGISPLRMMLPQGVTVQGVRSLSWPDRKQWRFLCTRRLFNFLRRALEPIGQSYAFEPNAPATWIQLRRDVERLLGDVFRRGAFAGATSREAFFVQVDEGLNPQDARDNGVLTARIGVAPSVPLEFLVVRLVRSAGVVTVAEESVTS